MVFVCYFANILVAVPKHWGVPYKDRLARFVSRSRKGFILEALNAAFSLVRPVDMLTYRYNRRFGRFF